MVVRAVSVIFLSVYLMAGNQLTVSAANGEKISEDSDFSVSGENMDSLLNSLDLSRIEAFLREAGGSAVPGLSFREILSMLLSGNYQRVVRMLMDFCRTALFREISENGRWMGQVILLGILGAVFASFSSLFADSQVSEMGFYVTYLLIFTLLAASFLNGVRITRTLLEQLFEFVRLFPFPGEVPRQQPDMHGHLLLSMWRNGCFYGCFCHAPSCMSCCRWRDI